MDLIYTNPVWPGYLADPFVLKVGADYYAYGTGNVSGDESDYGARIFTCLHSRDLARWELVGGALDPLPMRVHYWAPEVAEHQGRFYMYYSVAEGATDDTHRLHVAIADHPAGPFQDAGPLLQDVGFSIDAHPFCDPKDGQWYLFFARDFFDGRTGTGTAAVALGSDMLHTVGEPQTVLRAQADWQIYERNRHHYNRDWEIWHTVEGPFVVLHGDLYYCFYSGGAWQKANYGVSYGVAEHPLGPYRDEWSLEGPTVLRGVEDKVIGPGHNSIVIGPDSKTEFIVYHAWDSAHSARRICIDPLVWTPDGPRCDGPSYEQRSLRL